MARAMAIKTGNPIRKLVLIKLADNANDNGECWPSYQHIADHCECSRSAVRTHIDALIGMGVLTKENRMGINNGKGNTSNVYYLNLDTPVPPKSTAPVPSKITGMPLENTPPMPCGGTRTSHSFEPVNEPNDPPNPQKGGATNGSLLTLKKPWNSTTNKLVPVAVMLSRSFSCLRRHKHVKHTHWLSCN